jgi:hypothetical protein
MPPSGPPPDVSPTNTPPAVAPPSGNGQRPPETPATVDAVEVVRVLEAVTALCDRVVDYIEADRAERRLVVEALTRISQSLDRPPGTAIPAPVAPGGERVLGGSMPGGDNGTVDLREKETRVEVRCRFGDRWVDGFEIFDVVTDAFGIRYRLRRRIDGVVLPELFLATDIRHIETFAELDPTQPRRRHWSPT